MYTLTRHTRCDSFLAVNCWQTPGRTIVIKSAVYIVGVAFIAILLFVSSRVLPHPLPVESPGKLEIEIQSEFDLQG